MIEQVAEDMRHRAAAAGDSEFRQYRIDLVTGIVRGRTCAALVADSASSTRLRWLFAQFDVRPC